MHISSIWLWAHTHKWGWGGGRVGAAIQRHTHTRTHTHTLDDAFFFLFTTAPTPQAPHPLSDVTPTLALTSPPHSPGLKHATLSPSLLLRLSPHVSSHSEKSRTHIHTKTGQRFVIVIVGGGERCDACIQYVLKSEKSKLMCWAYSAWPLWGCRVEQAFFFLQGGQVCGC